jgi:hypothetical protein
MGSNAVLAKPFTHMELHTALVAHTTGSTTGIGTDTDTGTERTPNTNVLHAGTT